MPINNNFKLPRSKQEDTSRKCTAIRAVKKGKTVKMHFGVNAIFEFRSYHPRSIWIDKKHTFLHEKFSFSKLEMRQSDPIRNVYLCFNVLQHNPCVKYFERAISEWIILLDPNRGKQSGWNIERTKCCHSCQQQIVFISERACKSMTIDCLTIDIVLAVIWNCSLFHVLNFHCFPKSQMENYSFLMA